MNREECLKLLQDNKYIGEMKITLVSEDVSTECAVSIYDVINGTPEFNSFIDEFANTLNGVA